MIRRAPIGSVADINPRLPSGLDLSQKVSFLPMSAVSEDGRLLNQEVRRLEEVKKGFTYFERGDILLAKITPCFENGKAALVDGLTHPIGFGSTEFHVIRPNFDELDAKYLYYMISSPRFRFFGANGMKGAAGQKRVPTDFVRDYSIPLPPFPEQQRIAAILDKADAIRRKRQQAIQLADQFLRAVFLDMFGDPVTNPKGFQPGTIRQLVSSVNYGTSAKADSKKGEYPILRMGNITDDGGWDFGDLKYIDLHERDRGKHLAERGDLLFNRTNSKEKVGKTAVFELDQPMAIAGYLIRVRTNELANPYYVSGYLNSRHGKLTLREMCKAIVGMANINAQELQDIRILIPPKELQDNYADIVQAVKSRVRTMSEVEAVSDDLFNAISQKSFSGTL